MTKKIWIVAAAALLGFFVGSGIGIALGGGVAINGAFVVSGLSGLIAFLMVPKQENSNEHARGTTTCSSETSDELARSGVAVFNQLVGWVGSVLRAVWNLEMRFLAVLGLLRFFQKFPLLFGLLAICLLVLVFPAGVVFVATGIAALLRDPKAEEGFKVAWE